MYISDQLQREIGKALIQFGITWSYIIKLFYKGNVLDDYAFKLIFI